MPSALFGTDGIRGVAGEFPLDPATIDLIGQAAARVLSEKYDTRKIIVGWDTRQSSPEIAENLMHSFESAGYEVYEVGLFPTPGIAFLCQEYHSLGLVVSASHNPYRDNGIKFFAPGGVKLEERMEREIEQLVHAPQDARPADFKKGKRISFQQKAEEEYLGFLRSSFTTKSFEAPFLIDCANGSAYKIATKLFPEFCTNVSFIHTTPNGKNINENCGATNPSAVQNALPENAFGIAFDGDGDRIILADEAKNIRDGDYILGVLAGEYKRQNKLKNNLVIPTVMSNMGLLRYLTSENIQTQLAPVGDKYVYEHMLKYDANLGGEQSGHIILRDYLPTGDSMLVALQLLQVLTAHATTLREVCRIFEKYPQVLKNIRTQQKPELMEVYPAALVQRYEQEVDGRILIRYSGTEPLLRIMVEGKEQAQIERVAQELAGLFAEKTKSK